MRPFILFVVIFGSLLSSTAQVNTATSVSLLSLPDAPSSSRATGDDSVPSYVPVSAIPSVAEPDIEQLSVPAPNFSNMLIEPAVKPPESTSFQWESAGRQSFLFLSVQHGVRLLQPKTRAQLGGPFWGDYVKSIQGIQGWGDGDGPWTNYILHPGEGGIASWIFIQNSPKSRKLEFEANSGDYWRSRLKAMGFAAAFSTQFEIGLYSEATIGNVGKTPGTSGWVDFIMTPVGGFAFTVTEDAVDKHIIRKIEDNGASESRVRLYRVLLNPERSIANLLRLKAPWHRDTRSMP